MIPSLYWVLNSSLLHPSHRILGERGHLNLQNLRSPPLTHSFLLKDLGCITTGKPLSQSWFHFPLCTVGPRDHSASLRSLRVCGLQNRTVLPCTANPESAHGRTTALTSSDLPVTGPGSASPSCLPQVHLYLPYSNHQDHNNSGDWGFLSNLGPIFQQSGDHPSLWERCYHRLRRCSKTDLTLGRDCSLVKAACHSYPGSLPSPDSHKPVTLPSN